MLYNRESFPTNNKRIMQPRNFSTANDLHYTVCNHWVDMLLFNMQSLGGYVNVIVQYAFTGWMCYCSICNHRVNMLLFNMQSQGGYVIVQHAITGWICYCSISNHWVDMLLFNIQSLGG